MTPYQRGNRDGCLAMAGMLDQLADGWRNYADKVTHGKRHSWDALRISYLEREQVLRDAATMAIGRSEMLPEDPEEEGRG